MRNDDGVRHPVESRAAFLVVTRSNMLRLVYAQEPGHPWAEVMHDLGECSDSADLLTHAAIGDGKGEMPHG